MIETIKEIMYKANEIAYIAECYSERGETGNIRADIEYMRKKLEEINQLLDKTDKLIVPWD